MSTGTSNEADLASAAESWRWRDLPPSRPRLLRLGLASPASAPMTSAAQAELLNVNVNVNLEHEQGCENAGVAFRRFRVDC